MMSERNVGKDEPGRRDLIELLLGRNYLPRTSTAPETIFDATMGCSGLDVQRSFRSALWAVSDFVTIAHAIFADMSH